MKPLNEMKLTFDSKSSNEAFARAAVGAFITQLDPTISELSDIKTAVSEAVTNCVVHAYANDIGTIYISVQIFEGGIITIKIRDKGCGIENVEQAMEPLFTTAPDQERAGLGFAVMQSFTDTVKVRSKPNGGTTVTLTKRLARRLSEVSNV